MKKKTATPSPEPTYDDTSILVWAKLAEITAKLHWFPNSYAYLLAKVGGLSNDEHPARWLIELRALIDVHRERIAPDLPENLRGLQLGKWHELLDPADNDPIRTKFRQIVFRQLRDTAVDVVARHRAAALVEPAVPIDAPDGEAATKTKQPRYEWLAKAMLLVKENASFTDRKIAKAVGIDPGQLTRSPEYQAAAALARGSKQTIPRGSKNGLTGELEAEAETREID